MNYSKPIIIACKEAPERLPPVLSLLSVATKVFPEVFLVTNKTSIETKNNLERLGVKVIEGMANIREIKYSQSKIERIRSWLSFHRAFWKLSDKVGNDVFLWIATADSALAIGWKLLDRQYILGLLELYDQQKIYLKLIRSFVKNAAHVVTPEPCRSAIFRVWYDLPYTPTVLPNKPYGLDCYRRMPISDPDAKAKIDEIGTRKLLLYQARMVRMETFDIANAIMSYLGEEYVLGILGEIRDREMFARLREYYLPLIHFNYLQPPHHLTVTSHAHMGLLIYNYESLNNIFCAPNKTWEYAALSLPMLCHELPMLSEQLKYFHAGETFQSGDPKSIANKVRLIDADYENYCDGARNLYNSVDLKQIVIDILEQAYLNDALKLK